VKTKAFVGLDVGTTGVKAIAIARDGAVLTRAEHGYPLHMPRPGWSEQDPEDWWRAAETALAELAVEPAAIGLSGQMHGLVVLDERDRVVRPAILWNDQRTGAECREIEELVGTERLLELTGNPALTGFTAPKLLWLRRHEPDTYRRIWHILLPKDYVRLRLTGERAIDAADASGTLLFDVGRRRWSAAMLDALDVPAEWLPRALESPEISGVASHGAPVAAGAGDQAASALGVGVHEPGTTAVTIGTSGVVFTPLVRFAPEPRGRLHVFCHAVPDRWHAMGVMLSAGGSLRWFRDAFAAGESFERLTAEAEKVAPGADGVLFLPYLTGERTPHADPDARAAFVGLAASHGRGVLVRAVLEGVAFGLRDSLELIGQLDRRPVSARVSGGAARSRLWLRIVASVLGIPLERPAVEEGAAFGAALLGGVAGGEFASAVDAARATVGVRDVVEPDARWQPVYDEAYARFRALYPALRASGVSLGERDRGPDPPPGGQRLTCTSTVDGIGGTSAGRSL
jgi:xylulokinase